MDTGCGGYLGFQHDVTARMVAEQLLVHLSTHDSSSHVSGVPSEAAQRLRSALRSDDLLARRYFVKTSFSAAISSVVEPGTKDPSRSSICSM